MSVWTSRRKTSVWVLTANTRCKYSHQCETGFSAIVSFISMNTDVAIEATACATMPNTIRYETLRHIITLIHSFLFYADPILQCKKVAGACVAMLRRCTDVLVINRLSPKWFVAKTSVHFHHTAHTMVDRIVSGFKIVLSRQLKSKHAANSSRS